MSHLSVSYLTAKNQLTPFPMPCGMNMTGGNSLVSNFPINDDFEVEFWTLGVTRVDLDRRPTSVQSIIRVPKLNSGGKGNVVDTTIDAPFIVPDRQVLDHALHRHLFHHFLRRDLLVNDTMPYPRYDCLTRSSQRAYERHVKHTQWAGRKLPYDVRSRARLVQRSELDSRKLVPITR